jgi:hypothetical protein
MKSSTINTQQQISVPEFPGRDFELLEYQHGRASLVRLRWPLQINIDGLTAPVCPVFQDPVNDDSPVFDLKLVADVRNASGGYATEFQQEHFLTVAKEHWLGQELRDWARRYHDHDDLSDWIDAEDTLQLPADFITEVTDRDYKPLPGYEILEKPYRYQFLAGLIVYSVLAHIAFIVYVCFHENISIWAAL